MMNVPVPVPKEDVSGEIQCANTECAEVGIIKTVDLAMYPGESIYCGGCGEPIVTAPGTRLVAAPVVVDMGQMPED